jgi:hypothetical protein
VNEREEELHHVGAVSRELVGRAVAANHDVFRHRIARIDATVRI